MLFKGLSLSVFILLMAIPYSSNVLAMDKKASDAAGIKETKQAEIVTLLNLKWSKAQAAFVASKFVELNNILGSLQVSDLALLGSGFAPSNPGFDPFKIDLNKAFLPRMDWLLVELNANLYAGLDAQLEALKLTDPKIGKLYAKGKSKIYNDFNDQLRFLNRTLPKKVESLNNAILGALSKEAHGFDQIFAVNAKNFDGASRNYRNKLGVKYFYEAHKIESAALVRSLYSAAGMPGEESKSLSVLEIKVDQVKLVEQLFLINKLLSSLPISELTTLGSGFELSNSAFYALKYCFTENSFLPNTDILNNEVELSIKMGFDRDRKILEMSIPKRTLYEASVKKLEANYKKNLLSHKDTINKINVANKNILKLLSKSGGYDGILIRNGERFVKATQIVGEKSGVSSFLEFHLQNESVLVDKMYGQEAAAVAAEEAQSVN